MDISIIIVNYNAKKLLNDCLKSVQIACKGVDCEIWVVDNNSNDGSIKMLNENFLNINLIQNKENVGFSIANNKALKNVKGQNILILNPDTILNKDTIKNCLKFMRKNKKCGAIGVQMTNLKGEFLPESKRGFPTAWASFCKLSKLNNVFYKSKIFNSYHLGHLDKDQNHSVEILTGAFMFIRKNVLDKIGFFDEDFFMYGEDIDLSKRILNSGWENWYLGTEKIFHYKGGSTNKLSKEYVKHFYNAMYIFCKKYNPKVSSLYFILINIIKMIHILKIYLIKIITKNESAE